MYNVQDLELRHGKTKPMLLDTQAWSLMHTAQAGIFRFEFFPVGCLPSKTHRPRSNFSTTMVTLVVPTKRCTRSKSTTEVVICRRGYGSGKYRGRLDSDQQGRPSLIRFRGMDVLIIMETKI